MHKKKIIKELVLNAWHMPDARPHDLRVRMYLSRTGTLWGQILSS